jgi:hypothetical protein
MNGLISHQFAGPTVTGGPLARFARTGLLAVMVAAGAAGACSDDEPTTPTAPTAPTVMTETFSGNIARNGAQTHAFGTQASGTVTATLTALAAAEGTKIGLALGTFNGVVCQLVITKDDAVQGTVVTGAVSALGSLCVRIYDTGGLTQSADYEIQVAHP